jgi:molybdopterin-containing oxidoreductase family iron-sulfur binding subunit
LFNTRQAQESLLKWSGYEESYESFLKQHWKENFYPEQSDYANFKQFWQESLQNGVFAVKQDMKDQPEYKGDVAPVANKVSKGVEQQKLVLYQKVGIGNGQHANNPWLQEMPDPVTKITWDNYLMVSTHFAKEHNLHNTLTQSEGLEPTVDVLKVKVNGHTTELPAYIHPGLADNTMAVAVGYGRKKSGKAGADVGQNVYPFVRFDGQNSRYTLSGIKVEKTGKTHDIAQTQLHHNMHGRPILKDTTLEEYQHDPYAGNEEYKDKEELQELKETTLYPEREYKGHHWGMSIDLNACIGCSACIVACQAENNIPVVGKEEVKRKHEMHWLRIDRYYSGDEQNPEAAHQPMLCQHCDHAPCENVCPVAATNHSKDGLNQMIYNRCVGTKYCMNNCPYKVRRFNWYDYAGSDAFPWNEHIEEGAMSDSLARMVLNPDVTVRSRGVMEKCTFCVQRIQEGKLEAKRNNRQVEDGEVKTACQQACPTNAITFGDMNDEESEVAEEIDDERTYHVLHEYHTLPSVSYKTKVRNKEKEEKKASGDDHHA